MVIRVWGNGNEFFFYYFFGKSFYIGNLLLFCCEPQTSLLQFYRPANGLIPILFSLCIYICCIGTYSIICDACVRSPECCARLMLLDTMHLLWPAALRSINTLKTHVSNRIRLKIWSFKKGGEKWKNYFIFISTIASIFFLSYNHHCR